MNIFLKRLMSQDISISALWWLQTVCHVKMLLPLQYNTKHHIEPVTNGNYLLVSGVEPGDEGNYTCAVSTVKKEELSHYLRVRSKYDHLTTLISTEISFNL